MVQMLCWNRVRDFEKWKRIFDSQTNAVQKAGMRLTQLWQNIDDPNDVYFIFEISDVDKACEFINDPVNEKVGEEAGVIDGKIWFVRSV